LRASLARRGEERRGDHGDNNKGMVQNYESEQERENEREIERTREEKGVRESRRECELRDTLQCHAHTRNSGSFLLSLLFLHYFVTPLNGWKRGVCVGVEKDKVI
jgi:hypothetical protein